VASFLNPNATTSGIYACVSQIATITGVGGIEVGAKLSTVKSETLFAGMSVPPVATKSKLCELNNFEVSCQLPFNLTYKGKTIDS